MKCECGFKFSGPGEFRNCELYIRSDGKKVIVCPKCGAEYIKDRKAYTNERGDCAKDN